MCLLSVDVPLLQHWEGCFACISDVVEDVSRLSWLLVTELIARQCYDLETFRLELLMYLNQLIVVQLCKASLRGHVDHHYCFVTFAEIPKFDWLRPFFKLGDLDVCQVFVQFVDPLVLAKLPSFGVAKTHVKLKCQLLILT